MWLTVDYGDVSTGPEEVGLSSAGAPLGCISQELENAVITHKVLGQCDVSVLQTEGRERGEGCVRCVELTCTDKV